LGGVLGEHMAKNTDRNGKGEHRHCMKNMDRKVRDKERSSERNDYKSKLKNYVDGDFSHLDEDDLDEFE
jgi:hypothetical protein